MSELVSILIPVFNCREWVSHSVESALQQTYPNCEIIALDDCSTDESWDVLQRWRTRIHVERAAHNSGQNVSRNALTSMSRGAWLCYLDADDELTATAVAQKMKFSATADAVYGTMEAQHFRNGTLVGTRRVDAESFSEPICAAFQWKYPNTSAFMFRRSAVLDVGGWNENIQNCTDYDLYFRLLISRHKIRAAPDSVTVYRQWSDSQAVYQEPLRRMNTRLTIMWRSVFELQNQGRLTPAIRDAFFNSALSVLRSLYPIDVRRAVEEHRRLRDWASASQPSRQFFPRAFCIGYRCLGFRGAEVLAKLTRFLRPTAEVGLFPPVNKRS